jgi:hypothetical protein
MKTTELDDILNDIVNRRPVSLLQAERAQSELTVMRDRIAYLEQVQKAAQKVWNSFQELGKALEK